ncbi:MAG: hypothetical protein WC026_17375 [Hyphomicrobium sp.]|uniref:hypothetical protein n=1 Tax=Hyphomicrobium sp. TaxID=82 RepID=UPI003566DEDB
MTLLLLWAILGILGMLLTTWAYAQENVQASVADPENVERRTFTVGHMVVGVVFGPLAFVLGLLYALSMTPIMEYVERFLSTKLFTWEKPQ